MVFAIDEQTRRLVANVPQRRRCRGIRLCRSIPAETPPAVSDSDLVFRACAPDVPTQPTLERKVSVDIGTRTIDATFRKTDALL
jgi:hypothetical protein